MRAFGALKEPNLDHEKKYPILSSMGPPPVVERRLTLPSNYQVDYDQKDDPACVGASLSIAMAMLNYGDVYDFKWLWQNAKDFDYVFSTKKGDNQGTTVNGACRVLKQLGHVMVDKILRMPMPANKADGIIEYRWDHSCNGILWSIGKGVPVVVATDWFSLMNYPEFFEGAYWIGRNAPDNLDILGIPEGSHAYCIFAASTSKGYVSMAQSWGRDFPEEVRIPIKFMNKLLTRRGEVALITDRPTK